MPHLPGLVKRWLVSQGRHEAVGWIFEPAEVDVCSLQRFVFLLDR
jgi:hypothetical protein